MRVFTRYGEICTYEARIQYEIKFLGGLDEKRKEVDSISRLLSWPTHSRQHLRRVITSATVVTFPNVVSRASSALPSKELPRVGTIHPPSDSFSKSRLQTPVIDVSKRIADTQFARSSLRVVTAFELTALIHGRIRK